MYCCTSAEILLNMVLRHPHAHPKQNTQVVAVLKWYNFPTRSEVPQWIRSLLLSLPEDALRRFLIFVCGTPSLPAAAAGKVCVCVCMCVSLLF